MRWREEEHSEEDEHRKPRKRGAIKEEKRCSRQDNRQTIPNVLPGEMLSDVSASVRHSGRARNAAEPPPGFVYDLAREFASAIASDSDR